MEAAHNVGRRQEIEALLCRAGVKLRGQTRSATAKGLAAR